MRRRWTCRTRQKPDRRIAGAEYRTASAPARTLVSARGRMMSEPAARSCQTRLLARHYHHMTQTETALEWRQLGTVSPSVSCRRCARLRRRVVPLVWLSVHCLLGPFLCCDADDDLSQSRCHRTRSQLCRHLVCKKDRPSCVALSSLRNGLHSRDLSTSKKPY